MSVVLRCLLVCVFVVIVSCLFVFLVARCCSWLIGVLVWCRLLSYVVC